MGRVYMHLTYDQRLAIKQMLERGNSKKEIAESIGVHTSTIYREIDRGTVNGHYDPTAAEEAYQDKIGGKRADSSSGRKSGTGELYRKIDFKSKVKS